eukprot:11158735-Lingulodinium_polyedra.AAC.1
MVARLGAPHPGEGAGASVGPSPGQGRCARRSAAARRRSAAADGWSPAPRAGRRRIRNTRTPRACANLLVAARARA